MSEEKKAQGIPLDRLEWFLPIQPNGTPPIHKLSWPDRRSGLGAFWSESTPECPSEMRPMDGEAFAPDFGRVRAVKIPQLTDEAMTRAREVQQLIDRYPDEYRAFEDKERATRAEAHVSIYSLVTLLKQEAERFAAFIADLRKREEGERDE